jgi:glycosyltransferase involved in cell wall biosynthesis
MRVLHVLNELRHSGAETMLRGAGSYWKAQGIDGEILCTGEVPGSYTASLQDAGYRVHHLPFQRSIWFLHSVYRFLRGRQFDAVHIHTERAGFWYAGLAYMTGHRRIIRSLHSIFPFTGRLRARRWAQRLIMRRVFGVRMVAVSVSVMGVERRTFHNPCLVIPNWFDSGWYRPALPEERKAARATFGIERGVMAIASVGNCSPIKNHTAVLRAIANIPRDVNILYLHAGEERDSTGERELSEEEGIAGRIRFLGPVPDARAVLHACDLFVMPSLGEGFGVAAIEAMGAGVPVVCSDVEGLRDFRGVSAAIHWIEPSAACVEAAILHFYRLGAAERRTIGEQLSESAHRRLGIAAGAASYSAVYRGEPANTGDTSSRSTSTATERRNI